ncbi:MAG: tripartite tricarboxylate transporter substrate binding protein [Candidatus Rokubacteria bacterium]|nr:tripartite tricarboxylate transporter substrate binding protein [Candidatus Rokubacteria bacterium]
MATMVGRLSLIGVLAGLIFLALGSGPAAAWEPQRPIDFVIQTSPGGGSDVYARFWIGIIEKYKLSPVPVVPVNMPGGAGAVALAHLHSKKGDPHYISPTLNSVITTPLLQKIPVMYLSEDLTPIAKLMMDPFLLVVHPDNFKTIEEFLAACRERRLTAVGTGSKQEDEIQIFAMQHAFKCQPFRYVPEKGGGDVAKSVAGKHADFNVNQPSEMLPHYPARLIPILAFQKERPKAFPEVPTHWEKGINSQWAALLDLETGLHQMRGIIGPPDIPKDAVAWYEQLFRKVFETQEWQDFMKKGAMQPVFMNGEQYKKFLIMFENNHVKVMRDVIGWKLRDDLKPR